MCSPMIGQFFDTMIEASIIDASIMVSKNFPIIGEHVGEHVGIIDKAWL